MKKIYTALGLMSGTSMDGVDASVIKSDGDSQFTNIFDEYWKFDDKLRKKLIHMRGLITDKKDLFYYSSKLIELERELTIFHGEIVNSISSKIKENIDLIGFHGQTIFHDTKYKISKQLGDGYLLSQITKKTVIFDFRQKDIENGGQGAPLAPIFHKLVSKNISLKNKCNPPNILNIGGISNTTIIIKAEETSKNNIKAFDIGPGNCLIDEWVRKNSDKEFDENGSIGKSGKKNELIFNQAIENFNIISYDKSLDIKDFDISFARGLSLEDGCATITNFTAFLIAAGLNSINKNNELYSKKYLICGGGRKNRYLIDTIKIYLNNFEKTTLELIDLYNYNGDFIESQAFGYIAVRSYLGLPITFPSTTRCNKTSSGGKKVNNFN